MGFITIKKRNRTTEHFARQGIMSYGEPVRPKTSFKEKVVLTGKKINVGLHQAHEMIEKTQQSAGFKGFKKWLGNRNEYYQREFAADTSHLEEYRRGRR